MTNEYPRMLFKAGGPEQFHGGHFSTLIVSDDASRDDALADGWCMTTPDAVKAQQAEAELAAKLAEQAADSKPASREELEQKAAELGIAFSPRLSDKKLGEAIAAKLAEQAGE